MRQDNFQIDKNRKNFEFGVKMESFLKRVTFQHIFGFFRQIPPRLRKTLVQRENSKPDREKFTEKLALAILNFVNDREIITQDLLIGISDPCARHMELPERGRGNAF